MWSTIVPLLAVLNAVIGLEVPSFAPPSFEPSTIDNDGTHVDHLKSVFFLIWLTTVDGRKYHITLAPNFIGDNQTSGIFGIEDLSTLTGTGATVFGPATGSNEALNLRSEYQNFTSPAGSDNFTNLYFTSDYAGVTVDMHFSPTGQNLYIGGSGGITLPSSGQDFRTLMPGYSWYWANPTMRLNGTLTVNGEVLQVDYNQSFAYMERQTGTFDLSGYYAFWLYLSNGLMIHSWVVGPTLDVPYGVPSFATVWYPSGLHEVVSVDPTSTASDIWISNSTGKTYFNKFVFNLSAKNASLTIEQAVRNRELGPLPGTQGYIISEAYGQGSGV
ncbi:hypothetical protein B0J14DRAFT_687190 [Halenospora varia]|nr:hypothetical protein B0J14DRAFT_687190 [Halenospora varia]